MSKLRASIRASSFTESVIREMTRLSDLHGAINLGPPRPVAAVAVANTHRRREHPARDLASSPRL